MIIGQSRLRRGGHRLPVFGGGVAAALWAIPAMFYGGMFPVNLVGTGSGPFSSDYNSATFEDTGTTYYVTTGGSDTTGDGSSGNPWRTIQQAINTVVSGSKINVGAGRFPNFTLASKNVSVYGVANSTFVGDFLTESAITWGALASGRQTATLSSGALSGFVDLTIQQRGHYQVALTTTTAAAIATAQSGGNAGVFRAAPSQTGASDARNLSGSADTSIIAWSSLAAAPFILTGTAKLFAKNMSFVGGAQSNCPLNCRFVGDNCAFLGAVNYNLNNAGGTSVLYQTLAVGSAVVNANMINYAADNGGVPSVGVEINCLMDQSSLGGADNCSTAHGSKTLRINGSYTVSAKPVHDVGDSITGMFGCTLGGAVSSLAVGTGGSSSEMHCAGLTFLGTPTQDLEINALPTRMYFYDKSYVGKTLVSGGQAPTDRTGVKPAGDDTLFDLDPSQIGTLFQDVGATIPVTTSGQTVLRINDASGSGAYATVASGTLVYTTGSGKAWLVNSGAANSLRLIFNAVTNPFADNCNVIFGTLSSDANWILLGPTINEYVGNYRSGTNNLFNTHFPPTSGVLHHVDGGTTNYTGGTALAAAAFNGAAHVVSMEAIDLSWVGWQVSTFVNRTASTSFGFDGNLYGFQISRATTAGNLRTRHQAMGVKTGVVIP